MLKNSVLLKKIHDSYQTFHYDVVMFYDSINLYLLPFSRSSYLGTHEFVAPCISIKVIIQKKN